MRARRVDDQLNRLLGRWADAHRLTPRQTEVIRQQILAEPTTGDFDWWWRLLDPDGGAAFSGMAAATAWGTSDVAYAPDSQSISRWPMDFSSLPTWDHEHSDFQPYLRLT
jgi:hypothetical protein